MLLIPTMLCPKSWENMSGDESRRFCTYCKKHVHNLAALSVSERLALLSSPAASVCSRYKVAIRRPAKGREQSYYRHLLGYGAGVALTGSVLLVLWEMHDEGAKQTYYRAAASRGIGCTLSGSGPDMPAEFYEEHQTHLMGDVMLPVDPTAKPAVPAPGTPPPHVDLKLDPVKIGKLLAEKK